ncbi:MAG: aminotransferase class V-fold PLP-dependent enzyme [Clostridiales bacterium]|nr:aminotransferase class V-fold PLP-dependent enzyme [Candidatus Crickella merdequi]
MKESSTIAEYLVSHKNSEPISFHMPGHKGREELFVQCGYGDFVKNMVGNDVTEIPGADNLFDPRGTILRVKENYARLYGVQSTELLVNGSSAGIIASIMASVPRGGKLILGRNSHHSAFSAMRLGDITPVYLRPEIEPNSGLQIYISPEEVRAAVDENPDASAVLITSPNYYGILSDIESIADICHDNNMLLIVDEAHGAHLKFFDRTAKHKRAAENLGADLVVCSTHKTLLSYTGSGILNICSSRVDAEEVREILHMVQTTSPSYLLMGSLDINEKIMSRLADDVVARWKEDLIYFYRRADRIPGVRIFTHEMLDMTKINISMAELGLSGEKLGRELRYNNIWIEMVHGEYVMLMTGAGNRRGDYVELLRALEQISRKYGIGKPIERRSENYDFDLEVSEIPKKKTKQPLYLAEGHVMYSPVIIYPPGFPVVCPGEIMNMEAITCISRALSNRESVVGVDDEGQVTVGELE